MGWNLRQPRFGEGELLLLGAYFPFAATTKERTRTGDPRRSLEERYPTVEHYLKAVALAAEALRRTRLLLAEDVARIVQAATARADE